MLYGAIDFHNQQEWTFFRSKLFADRAGYYVYLPYLFDYKLDASLMPEDVVNETGKGFSIEGNKLVSKYPIGVAVLQSPFYLVGKLFSSLDQSDSNPFNNIASDFVLVSAPFYVSVGLFFLFLFFRENDVSVLRSTFLILLVAFGSPVFYYTVIEGLMSHSYSFSLFALFIYFFQKFIRNQIISTKQIIVLSVLVSFVLLVRPINLVLLLFTGFSMLLLSEVEKNRLLKKKLALLFVSAIPIAIILAIPQFLYYKQTFGSFLHYSYQGESFDFGNPIIMKSLFSANAGLFVYTPFYFMALLAIIKAGIKNPKYFAVLVFFALGFYMNSCWHSWTFGCGFGLRPYVEWVPLLVMPLGFVMRAKNYLPYVIPIFALIIYYNVTMSYKWTGCWFGESETFSEFFRMFWP